MFGALLSKGNEGRYSKGYAIRRAADAAPSSRHGLTARISDDALLAMMLNRIGGGGFDIVEYGKNTGS
jgi:hypothetical protein